MKRMSNLIIFVGISLSFVACSSKEATNPDSKVQSSKNYQSIKDKYFKKGYDQALEDMGEHYVKKGFDHAKKALSKKYKSRMFALEAGKYALKKQKVTPPEMYSVEYPDGSVKIDLVGCKMERENTPEEILEFYYEHEILFKKKKGSSSQVKNKQKTSKKQAKTINVLKKKNVDVSKGVNEEFKLKVDATVDNLRSINQHGVKYNSVDDKLEIIFKDKEQRAVFCNETGICK
jgi:hypothetical protein